MTPEQIRKAIDEALDTADIDTLVNVYNVIVADDDPISVADVTEE